MAANDFEKNVRRVMDDLKLHPSGEVWQRVEERIRANRRKRRIMFFIIFALMALAVGGYGIYNFSDTQHTRSKLVGENTDPGNRQPHQSGASMQTPAVKQDKNTEDTAPAPGTVKKNVTASKIMSKKNPVASNGATKKQRTKEAANRPSHNRATEVSRIEDVKTAAESKVERDKPINGNSDANQKIIAKDISLSKDEPVSSERKSENMTGDSMTKQVTTNILKDTLNKNEVVSAARKPKAQNQTFKKWKWGLNLSLGASIITQDPFSFKGSSNVYANAYNAPGASTGGAPGGLYGPSPNKPAFAFKTGLNVETQISGRSDLSVALSYAYLADKIKVGQNNTQLTSASRSAYYTAAPENTYTDHFHFIELPVMYQWRMTKNSDHYFSLSGGTSVSYLLSTNALVYDTALHGIYYEAGSVLNRAHFNFLAGISYRFAKASGFELATGPQFSFDVSKLIQSNVDKRKYFLYIGLGTRIYFGRMKKK